MNFGVMLQKVKILLLEEIKYFMIKNDENVSIFKTTVRWCYTTELHDFCCKMKVKF